MNEVIMLHNFSCSLQYLSFKLEMTKSFSHFPPSPSSTLCVSSHFLFKEISRFHLRVCFPAAGRFFFSHFQIFPHSHSTVDSNPFHKQTRETTSTNKTKHGKISLRHTKITANSNNDVFTERLSPALKIFERFPIPISLLLHILHHIISSSSLLALALCCLKNHMQIFLYSSSLPPELDFKLSDEREERCFP